MILSTVSFCVIETSAGWSPHALGLFRECYNYTPTIIHGNSDQTYAWALMSGTRLPLTASKCAWFDEHHYYEFFPLHAVHPK